ncbi:MAG: helix-turn-helix transcriptional regulator [Bacteroidales bacterium]|nr:helix-turn-helix transcriptional regulator [Bacteroidales bacterium]
MIYIIRVNLVYTDKYTELRDLETFTLAGLQRITGVNQKQLGHYISGYRKPSNKTVRKIEDGIHRFSQQLSAVRFV